MMQRRHFESIAATIKALALPNADTCRLEECDRTLVAYRFADMCRLENPNFDRARFLKACGVTED